MTTEGSCHCGAVRISVAKPPADVNSCNCSICHRLGTLWAYYATSDVRIEGPTVTYAWGEKTIDFHHCPTCGCTTHWSPRGERKRLGINARLLDYELLAGTPVRHSNNR